MGNKAVAAGCVAPAAACSGVAGGCWGSATDSLESKSTASSRHSTTRLSYKDAAQTIPDHTSRCSWPNQVSLCP